MTKYFIGIDVGTQGTRVVLLDDKGSIVSSEEQTFVLDESSREEQSPGAWWLACRSCMEKLGDAMPETANPNQVVAITVTSTSGTVIPLDENFQPLHAALMYSDKRSSIQAEHCASIALKYHHSGFTAFNSSCALPKIVWYGEKFPKQSAKVRYWVHAADYITGMLSDCWGITDYTNALKTGFDINQTEWPDYLFSKLNLKKEWLPKVLPSGTVIGNLKAELALAFGLPETVQVTVGITDGCASQIASGAVNPGDWNTTIGTTMVIKGVTEKEIVDPEGRIYSHRHPEGYWMPGGASNTGADWVTQEFSEQLLPLNSAAAKLIPTNYLSYPLRQRGERFPMVAPQAIGFEEPGLSDEEKFTANLEGVAYLERYAFEIIQEFTNEKVKHVFTAGGGSHSEVWLKIRCNVLNLPVYKMKEVSGAVGAAILAASRTHYPSLGDAVAAMTVVEQQFHPEAELALVYEENYQRFKNLLIEKGYIKKGEVHA